MADPSKAAKRSTQFFTVAGLFVVLGVATLVFGPAVWLAAGYFLVAAVNGCRGLAARKREASSAF